MNDFPRTDLTGDARVVEWAIRRHVLQHGRAIEYDELDSAAPLTPMKNDNERIQHVNKQRAALATLLYLGLVMVAQDGWHHLGVERELLDGIDTAKASVN